MTVHRFEVAHPRRPDFDDACRKLLARPRRASEAEQAAWIDEQGPVSPPLLDAIATTDADVVAFHPYLYNPTVVGLPRVARRSILHPATHDEAPIRLPIFRAVFASAAGLVFWSEAERRLTERLFPIAARPQLVLGVGVEPPPRGENSGVDVGEAPYLLCLGRVDDGKGVHLLAECFTRYRARRPSPLRLVFAGPVIDPPPAHPGIVVAGRVDDATKWSLLRGALALVSPSAYESLSIVLLEAWSVGTPALVNRRCAVTTEHALASGAGLAFGTYAEFEVLLDRLRESPTLRAQMGTAGNVYVDTNYRWPDLVRRYTTLLEHIAEQ